MAFQFSSKYSHYNVSRNANVNKLNFPGDMNEYVYKGEDFALRESIESSRHIVEGYEHIPTGKQVAMKTIRITHGRYQEKEKYIKIRKLIKEVKNFRILSNHKNIVNFYGLCINDGEVMICMELMDLSLYDLYNIFYGSSDGHSIIFPEHIIGYTAVQIIDALSYCKSKNLMHRDLKPKNVLTNISGEVKLCDFGESRILNDSLASTFVGTILYWPPERFNNPIGRYDIRSDVWSLGITLLEIAYGKMPILEILRKSENSMSLDFGITQSNRPGNIIEVQNAIGELNSQDLVDHILRNNYYSNEFIQLVLRCLEKVDQRLNHDNLKDMKFYKKHENMDKVEMGKFVLKYIKTDHREEEQISHLAFGSPEDQTNYGISSTSLEICDTPQTLIPENNMWA